MLGIIFWYASLKGNHIFGVPFWADKLGVWIEIAMMLQIGYYWDDLTKEIKKRKGI